MSNVENNDINNLDIDSIHVDDNIDIFVVPVAAPIIRDEKRRDNTIKNFKQTMTSAEIIRSFDVKIDDQNEDEPFKDFSEIEYVVTDLNSLKNIKENKRFNCDFGLRFYIPSIDETKLFIISDDIMKLLKEANVESINSKVDFNQLQDLVDDIVDQLQLTLSFKGKDSLEELINIKLPVGEEGGSSAQKDNEEATDNLAAENETEVNENTEIEESEVQSEEQSIVENNVIGEIDEQNEEVGNIEILKKELYSMINALVPKVYLNEDEVEFRSIISDKDYDESALPTYKKLEELTKEEFQQAKNDRITASQKRRENIVRSVYEELVPEIWTRSIEADTLLNYKSDSSDYHMPFKEIESKFEATKELIPERVEEYKNKIFDEFERDKEYRAEKARKEMAEKIENEERPIAEQRIREYEEDLNRKATDVYNEQLDTLNVDVTHSWQVRYSKIVDDVVKQHRNYIDQKSSEVESMMESDLNKTLEDRNTTNEKLRAKISRLEEARINDAKNFEERVAAEVKDKTNDYELRDSQMNEEIRALRTDLQTYKNSNTDTLEEVRRLKIEKEGDKEEIRRLNEKLLAAQQESYNTTKEAMEIQKAALSNLRSPNFSNVAALNNEGVGNLPDDVAEKVKRLEKRKKPGFITWISGIIITILIGTGASLNTNAAHTQKVHQEEIKQEQQDQKAKAEEREQALEKAKQDKQEAEKQAEAEKQRADKAEKDKKAKDDKKKDDKK
ncbi:hypothetical protein [Staphylococcus saprophyticus]|uniref:hypothetical protein n=1 Tax=Staphylococcus saprophyticus TaxID=29385 RepID=UPI0034C6AEC8